MERLCEKNLLILEKLVMIQIVSLTKARGGMQCLLLLWPPPVVDDLVDDHNCRLLVDFFIIVVVILLIVVTLSWMRGRLGDGAFDEILKVIAVVWILLKHCCLVTTKS